MEFLWDGKKARANFRKHQVSFEEAATVLKDALAITGADPDHSVGEYRWLTFGVSDQGRLLAVAHSEGNKIIRIISARIATHIERKLYEEG